jgi:hypothetical protein
MKKGVFIVAVLVVILIVVIFMNLSEEKFVLSDDCNELKAQINDLIDEANYCEEDSDCIISEEFTKGCDCFSIINNDVDLSLVKDGWDKYAELNCFADSCEPCALTPDSKDVLCVKSKCKDTR